MYEENQNLVHFVIKHSYPTYIYNEDLHQIGCLGLWKACLSYSEDKGRFSTYGVKLIKNEISAHFRELNQKRKIQDDQIISLCAPAFQEKNEKNKKETGDLVLLAKKNSIWCGLPLKDILSERQKKIMKLCSEGKTQREIGKILGISHTLVFNERKNIIRIIEENTIDI